MSGFAKGTYGIRSDGKPLPELSRTYKSENHVLDAIKSQPPGRYEVYRIVNLGEVDSAFVITKDGRGNLLVNYNPDLD